MSFEDLRDHFAAKDEFPEHAEWISEHLAKYFEEEEIMVFHEMTSLDFHLDVYFIQSEKYSFNILLTSGMSTLAMEVEEDIPNAAERRFGEVLMIVPKDIDFGEQYSLGSENAWIYGMLKQTARFPHHHDVWVGMGHTLQADADMEPYDEKTKYVAGILLPSVSLPDEFMEIRREDRVINFFSFFPMYESELRFKIENGYNAFLDLLGENDINDLFDINHSELL